jgi:hypothetical protein
MKKVTFRSAALDHNFVVRSTGTRVSGRFGIMEPLEVICSSRELATETYEKFVSDRFKPEVVELLVRGKVFCLAGPQLVVELAA